MQERVSSVLKRKFAHVSGLPPSYIQKNIFLQKFFLSKAVGKGRDLYKRAFKGPKNTFINVSGLTSP